MRQLRHLRGKSSSVSTQNPCGGPGAPTPGLPAPPLFRVAVRLHLHQRFVSAMGNAATRLPRVSTAVTLSNEELVAQLSKAIFDTPIWGRHATSASEETASHGSSSVAETELCALAAEIQATIGLVEANSASALEELERRAAGKDAGLDESTAAAISLEVRAAAAAKIAALETEAVGVDAALEDAGRLRADAAALLSLATPERALLLTTLDRVSGLRARLSAMPNRPLELSDLALLPPETVVVGSVLAPRGALINPLRGTLGVRSVGVGTAWPGRPLCLDIVMLTVPGDEDVWAAHAGPAHIAALLRGLATRTSAHAVLRGASGDPHVTPLEYTVTPQPADRCVRIAVDVPAGTPIGGEVIVDRLTVCGLPVPPEPCAEGGKPLSLPLVLLVRRGLMPPFQTPAFRPSGLVTPAISPAGELFVPGEQGRVDAYSATGDPLPTRSFAMADLDLSGSVQGCAAPDGSTLLVAQQSPPGQVAAVDLDQRKRRWVAAIMGCYCVATLPSRDVLFATSASDNTLYAFRLSDGKRVASATPPSATIVFAATDTSTDTVYVSTGSTSVYPFTWIDHTQTLQKSREIKALLNTSSASRPIAVVPSISATGRRDAHLVVGSNGLKSVRVRDLHETCVLNRPYRLCCRRCLHFLPAHSYTSTCFLFPYVAWPATPVEQPLRFAIVRLEKHMSCPGRSKAWSVRLASG